MAFGAATDVIFAFAISFSIPYLLGTPGANLSARVGFVFLGFCAFTFIASYLLVPELTGRTLEEVDELYDVSACPYGQQPQNPIPFFYVYEVQREGKES